MSTVYRIVAMALVVLAGCLGARGQEERLTLKPYAGMSLYQFIGDEADGCRMRPGIMAGAEARYRLTDYMSISGGVEYVPRGSNLRNMDGYLRQDHLSIPILLHFHPFGPHLSLTLGAAPSFSIHNVMKAGGREWESKALFYGNDVLIPLGINYTFGNGLNLGARLSAGRKTMVRRDAVYQGVRYNLRGAAVNNNEISIIIGYQIKL